MGQEIRIDRHQQACTDQIVAQVHGEISCGVAIVGHHRVEFALTEADLTLRRPRCSALPAAIFRPVSRCRRARS